MPSKRLEWRASLALIIPVEQDFAEDGLSTHHSLHHPARLDTIFFCHAVSYATADGKQVTFCD